MKIWKKAVGILAVAGVSLSLAACGTSGDKKDNATKDKNPSSVDAIKKRGEIKIAVFGDLSPYGYLDADGKNQGYDVYLGNQIAKDLGVKVKYVIVNAEERVDALKSNKVDLVLANFTKTPEREKVIDFANPYMKVAIGVASLKEKPITEVNLKQTRSMSWKRIPRAVKKGAMKARKRGYSEKFSLLIPKKRKTRRASASFSVSI